MVPSDGVPADDLAVLAERVVDDDVLRVHGLFTRQADWEPIV
jgi:hypothetical protein